MGELTLEDTFDYCFDLKLKTMPALSPGSVMAAPRPWALPPADELVVRIVYGDNSANEISSAYEALGQMCEKWLGPLSPICQQSREMVRNEWALIFGQYIRTGRHYRDHVLHAFSVRVVIRELLMLFPEFSGIFYRMCRESAAEAGGKGAASVTDGDIDEAITRASLLHDFGYSFVHARKIVEELGRWYGDSLQGLPELALREADSGNSYGCPRFENTARVFAVPDGKCFDHGTPTSLQVCRQVLRDPGLSPQQRGVWTLVCRAIGAHDSGQPVAFESNPLGFLLCLADELQEYGRPYYDFRPRFEFRPRVACSSLALTATARCNLTADLRFDPHVAGDPTAVQQIGRKVADRLGRLQCGGTRLGPTAGPVKVVVPPRERADRYQVSISDIVLPVP